MEISKTLHRIRTSLKILPKEECLLGNKPVSDVIQANGCYFVLGLKQVILLGNESSGSISLDIDHPGQHDDAMRAILGKCVGPRKPVDGTAGAKSVSECATSTVIPCEPPKPRTLRDQFADCLTLPQILDLRDTAHRMFGEKKPATDVIFSVLLAWYAEAARIAENVSELGHINDLMYADCEAYKIDPESQDILQNLLTERSDAFAVGV